MRDAIKNPKRSVSRFPMRSVGRLVVLLILKLKLWNVLLTVFDFKEPRSKCWQEPHKKCTQASVVIAYRDENSLAV